jgi:hypothetical protein
MRLIKTLCMLLPCLVLLACNLGAAARPEGGFICMGYHNGFGAEAGVIFLYPDGTFNFNTYEGTWGYNADTQELTFEENVYLATGIYHPEGNSLTLTLKPNAPVTHAETGQITCSPGEELQQPVN